MKEIALFSVALLLGGCAYGIVDRSNEVRNAETLATCYVTVKPAFLYEARCADLDASGFGDSTFCTGIQGFDPAPYEVDNHTYHYEYPKSWAAYLDAKNTWDETLFKKLLFEKQRSIIAPVNVGTTLEITGVYEYPRGETGRVLILKTRLTSGEFNGTEVELPSRGGFSDAGPDWVRQWTYRPDQGIELSSEYLEPCDNQSVVNRVK
ncbi:hypothetical protein [Halopseudomonas oceani]|uniref:Lipoprotein n=1 Tax=Halopseudomonas oceani TaxID=1708783 RepID=A0A2P4EWY0_9GAMM|nr:hypothetical protein [Halopseudomonas oceani]POB04494.1 hypothetical protein C1949_05830 [Halopseudomonas oceani]